MRRGAVVIAALVALAPPRSGVAQSAADLLGMGVRAYQSLDYDAAAAVLRRGLLRTADDTLAAGVRHEALMYLGATELFRGGRDSAVAALRRLVVEDPRYRPNELVFPPQVTDLFREVLRVTPAVAVDVPPLTELRVRTDRLTARLEASSPHDVTVAVTRPDGKPLRALYSGPITDSLKVTWDGFTESGALPADGRYQLRVTSAALSGPVQRAIRVPLEIARLASDTPPPLGAPLGPARARAASGPAVRSLAGGVLAAAAVIALPSVIAKDADASQARFAVAAAISVSGLVSFLRQRAAAAPVDATTSVTRSRGPDGAAPPRVAPTARLRIRAGQPALVEREGR